MFQFGVFQSMSSSLTPPVIGELRHEFSDDVPGRKRYSSISSDNIGPVTALVDCIFIVTFSVVTALAYHILALSGYPSTREYLAIGNIAALVFISMAASRNIYKVQSLSNFRNQIRRIILPWVIAVLVCCLILFLFKSGADYSRGSLAIFGVVGFGLLVGTRYAVSLKLNSMLLDDSLLAPLAITIGDIGSLSYLPKFQILRKWGLREVGRSALPDVDDLERDLAVVDDAIASARLHNVQFVLLALKWSNGRRRDLISERLQILPVPVLLLPDEYVGGLLSQGFRQFGSELAVEVQRAPLSPTELAIKRALDLFMAGTILVAISPLLAAVSLLIKLELARAGHLSPAAKRV